MDYGRIPNVVDALRTIVDALKASNKEAEKTRLMLRESFLESSEYITNAIRNKMETDDRQDRSMEFTLIQMSREFNDYLERNKRHRKCAGMFQKSPKCHHVVDAGSKDKYWEQLRIEIAKEELAHLHRLQENHNAYFEKPMEVLAVEYADTFINELKKKGASNENN